MATKRAKTITKAQFEKLLKIVSKSDHALRDEVALRLSFFAGLRACEIAGLRWSNNLCDATGAVSDTIHITSDVAKRSVERFIPTEPKLLALLTRLRRARPEDEYVFYALHNNQTPMVTVLQGKKKVRVPNPDFVLGRVSANAVSQWFKRLYAQAEFEGCSSHSGRRTFVTARARMANMKQCSIRDVQVLAGHASLETTAAYIEPSEFQRDLVSAW